MKAIRDIDELVTRIWRPDLRMLPLRNRHAQRRATFRRSSFLPLNVNAELRYDFQRESAKAPSCSSVKLSLK
jgi:hypothetical protein